jgi:hypothetical protein
MNNQTSILTDIEPTSGELTTDELDAVNGGAGTLLTNLANKHYEMLNSIANNLRG